LVTEELSQSRPYDGMIIGNQNFYFAHLSLLS